MITRSKALREASEKELEVLLRLHEDDRAFARHHEEQRATASNLIVAVSAGLAAFVSFDDKVNLSDVPAAVFIVLLGVFGALFTFKHSERGRLHLDRAKAHFDQLDERFPDLEIGARRAEVDQKNRSTHRLAAGFRTNKFWIAFHIIISVIGLLILAQIASETMDARSAPPASSGMKHAMVQGR